MTRGTRFPLSGFFWNGTGRVLNGLKMKEIKLTQGKVALVDDEDYEYLNQWKWNPIRSHKNYYAARGGLYFGDQKKTISMHRVIMDTPPGACLRII